jgi:5-methylcytosine-specific restriction protein B
MSRFNPNFSHSAQIFEAADQFKKSCLLGRQSLFLDGQALWTTDHFNALIENYVKQPDVGDGGFYDKLEGQLALCSSQDVALMAELFWIVQLAPTNLAASYKAERVKHIWNMNPAAPFPDESPYLDAEVLSGLGSAGPGYNLYLWMEMVFAVEAFSAFVAMERSERESLLGNGFAFAEWLESIPSGKGRQLYHTLCHVLFPDAFERIFSQSQKFKVARAHKIWSSSLGESRPSMDAALLELRKRLELQYPGQVDYYEEPVGTLIKSSATEPESSTATVFPAGGTPLGPVGMISEDASGYGVDVVTNAKPALRLTYNLILYGPPGTGKTFEMQARMKRAFDDGGNFVFVTFHPSYSYEDFIGGLRPVAATDGSGIAVAFQKGPFLTLCEKAHADPTQQYTLFIDEINRANVAKVFGELITLIEPSKRVIAGSKASDNELWVTVPGLNDRLGVPDNLNVVATMNTADRSIAMMDIALRRRFRFQECPPEPHRIEPAAVGAIELPKLLQCINDRLEYLLDRDHLIGHALFMGIHSLDRLQQVLAEQIIPLLQEYFFEDMEKVRLVLTGSSRHSAFFDSRRLSPAELFPGAKQSVGTESRSTFSVGHPASWTEAQIISLYSGAPKTASPAELDMDPEMTPGPSFEQSGV